MPTKTISLEMDAYEKLKRAKRSGESFSGVVRRARFDAAFSTGASILKETAALYAAKRGVSKKTLAYWDEVAKSEAKAPRITPSKWKDS